MALRRRLSIPGPVHRSASAGERATARFTIHFGGKRATIQLSLRRRPNHRFNRRFGVNRIIETASPRFGADELSQARLTSLLRQPNESSETQMRTSVHSSRFQEEPTIHFGGKRAADLHPRSCRDTKDAGVACTPKLCAAFRLKTCETRPNA